jgi:hypothetical protein
MTEHLAFDQLQPIDLSFGLSIAPEADNAVVAHYSDQSESQGMLTLWKDIADTLIATIKEPDDSHHRQPRASVRRQGAIKRSRCLFAYGGGHWPTTISAGQRALPPRGHCDRISL